jgi:BirA family biotin operon repressor/biotin-[acetyl-CoA-carboxylase] ligase
MKLIKLDAIDSTNDYLKQLSTYSDTENFTVVIAKEQTNGKGQMGSKWESEKNKNLIVSILIKNILSDSNQIFNLNIAISSAIFNALKSFQIPNLSIKWPNDILSGKEKIAGILIENIIKADSQIFSIIGFGINVNQTNFDNLINANSLKNIINKELDINSLLVKIIDCIKENIELLKDKQENLLWENYNNLLFRKSIPTVFEDSNHNKFMGIIQEVSRNGKLILALEDNLIQDFEIKKIKMLY